MHAENIIQDESRWDSMMAHPRKAVMSALAHIADHTGWASSWGCFLDLLLAYLERVTHENADQRWVEAGARFGHATEVFGAVRTALVSLTQHFFARRGFCDVLGPVHQDVSSRGARAATGQFFTPWGLCMLNAQMQMTMDSPLKPDGTRWSVCDPAVGSGAMLLAAKAVFAQKFGWERVDLLEVAGQDIDYTAVRACRAQMYLSSPAHMTYLLATDGLKSADAMRAVQSAKMLARLSVLVASDPPVQQEPTGQLRLL